MVEAKIRWGRCSPAVREGWGNVGGRFQWFLPPTFLQISGSHDHNTSIFTNINEFHEFWWLFDFRNTTYEFEPKWEETQAGWPRLGQSAYPCAISSCNSPRMVLSTLSSKAQVLDTRTINQDRKACTKSNWVHISVTNHSTKTQTDLRSITRPWINVTRQRRAEMCQSQADRPRWGRPAKETRGKRRAVHNRLKERIQAIQWRSVPDGAIPRPAGLGEAGRPHLSSTGAPPWRGS